jgi:hypothetical protein
MYNKTMIKKMQVCYGNKLIIEFTSPILPDFGTLKLRRELRSWLKTTEDYKVKMKNIQ